MTHPPSPALVALLDGIDPFRQDTTAPAFDEERLRAFADTADAVPMLIEMAADDRAPLGRRYAAAEAIAQLGAIARLTADGDATHRVALMLADAMQRDAFHNRWGLPGHFVGDTGKLLLALGAEARAALQPLLANEQPLNIIGSQAATLQEARRYRIRDLAAYLLATRDGMTWQDGPDPAVSDRDKDRSRD